MAEEADSTQWVDEKAAGPSASATHEASSSVSVADSENSSWPQGGAFEASEEYRLLSHLEAVSRSPLQLAGAQQQQLQEEGPGQGAPRRRRVAPLNAGLWGLVVALAAAVAGYALVGGRRQEEAAPFPLGGPPPADMQEEQLKEGPPLEAPPPAPEPAEEAAAAAAAKQEDLGVEGVERMLTIEPLSDDTRMAIQESFKSDFCKGGPEAVSPDFLMHKKEAVEAFFDFAKRAEALDTRPVAGETDRERRRRQWTLLLMHQATLANFEASVVSDLSKLMMKPGLEEQLQESRQQLETVYKMKLQAAKKWLLHIEEAGVSPEVGNDEILWNMMRAQQVYYARALNKLVGLPERSTPEAQGFKGSSEAIGDFLHATEEFVALEDSCSRLAAARQRQAVWGPRRSPSGVPPVCQLLPLSVSSCFQLDRHFIRCFTVSPHLPSCLHFKQGGRFPSTDASSSSSKRAAAANQQHLVAVSRAAEGAAVRGNEASQQAKALRVFCSFDERYGARHQAPCMHACINMHCLGGGGGSSPSLRGRPPRRLLSMP
ncbi:hypothetical protein Efla_001161 [Eimeria flavescens]